MLKTSLVRLHGWVFGPVLVLEVVTGAVGQVGRVLMVFVHLGKVGPREERQQPVEIYHLESVCLDGIETVLVRCQLLMQTVDCIIQSKEEGDVGLGCLCVNCQSGGGHGSCLRRPGGSLRGNPDRCPSLLWTGRRSQPSASKADISPAPSRFHRGTQTRDGQRCLQHQIRLQLCFSFSSHFKIAVIRAYAPKSS